MNQNTPAALTDYIQQIINRNQREDFLRELLTMTVILEQEWHKLRKDGAA